MSSQKPCTNFHRTPHACLMLLGSILLETYWIHHHHHDGAEFCAILKVTTDALSPNQYCCKFFTCIRCLSFLWFLNPGFWWFLVLFCLQKLKLSLQWQQLLLQVNDAKCRWERMHLKHLEEMMVNKKTCNNWQIRKSGDNSKCVCCLSIHTRIY
jgi:hypothetical protein